MNERSKVSAFFCENCGKPVPLAAQVCPHCGRRFDAVKCPRCGYLGKPELFLDGCPSCGYARSGEGHDEGDPKASSQAARGSVEAKRKSPKTDSKKRATGRPRQGIRLQPPRWAYTAAALFLVIVLAVLLYIIFRRVLPRGG